MKLTSEEIKQGCSTYIDHGGGIGSHCRLKPTLKCNGKIYCTLHNPARLKAISDKRSAEYIDALNQSEQRRKDSDNRLRKEGYEQAGKEAQEKVKAVFKEIEDYGWLHKLSCTVDTDIDDNTWIFQASDKEWQALKQKCLDNSSTK